MKDSDSCSDMGFAMLIFMCLLTTCFLVAGLAVYYKIVKIPENFIHVVKHNLESTPIMDILMDNNCSNKQISNILGYYYGFAAGFKYGQKAYKEGRRKDICKYWKEDCIKVNSHKTIPYRIFKGKRLCTSKRPNKSYFDYYKSSIEFFEECPDNMKKCGKLDNYRILCVKYTENCPINDIVYNNESQYRKNDIIYKTLNISENEFLHYTNEMIENAIITNLTVLGGLPCGVNDKEEYQSYSSIENNVFCIGKD